MGKLIPILSSILVLGFVSTASGSGVTECGNFETTGWAHNIWTGYWTYSTVMGFTPAYNLTTRQVRCFDGRPFSLVVSRYFLRHRHGFNCRYVFHGSGEARYYDIRCVRGNQVIRWQGGRV